jgi:hypothetical protein
MDSEDGSSAASSTKDSLPRATHETSDALRHPASDAAADAPRQSVFTYREFVRQHLGPRDLAREIVERSRVSSDEPGDAWRAGEALNTARPPDFPGASSRATRERIEAIYLSPDAFARRTDEATIAEQMGDIFAEHGLPRPVAADNDRVGGWMLMYQMLDAGEWIVSENCTELIRTLPGLGRDPARVEDIEKMDGDDSADAARYGLKSRLRSRQLTKPPLEQRLASRVTSADPTIRAIQALKAQLDERRRAGPISFLRRPR